MPKKIGFDNERYLEEQTQAIFKRVEKFDNKLYLEERCVPTSELLMTQTP